MIFWFALHFVVWLPIALTSRHLFRFVSFISSSRFPSLFNVASIPCYLGRLFFGCFACASEFRKKTYIYKRSVFMQLMRLLPTHIQLGWKRPFFSSFFWKYPLDWYHVAFNCFISSKLNGYIVSLDLIPMRESGIWSIWGIDGPAAPDTQWPNRKKITRKREDRKRARYRDWERQRQRETKKENDKNPEQQDKYHFIWSIWIWWTFNYCSHSGRALRFGRSSPEKMI